MLLLAAAFTLVTTFGASSDRPLVSRAPMASLEACRTAQGLMLLIGYADGTQVKARCRKAKQQ